MKSWSPAIALILVAASCGGAPTKTVPVTADTTAAAPEDPSCPVAVRGTSVSVEESDRGVALVFVSTGDLVDLRKRTASMAAIHNTGDGMIRVPSQATPEDIVGGARIVFTVAPADHARLHDELRLHAQHMGAGTCAMDDHSGHVDPVGPDVPPQPEPEPVPTAEQQQAALVAAELAAYEGARPVFEKYCAGCHAKGGRGAKPKTLGHFEMTSYPFGGHHVETIHAEIREVLGATGKKPTMPRNKPGSVKGDELALILAWADAFDASHGAGAQPKPTGGHDH